MKCQTSRCYTGGKNHVIPPQQSTPYVAGATSPSESALKAGQINTDNQMSLNKAFRGGSGRIPVAQPQQLAGNQSGNQGANNTTVKMAENLSQGHANSEYDCQITRF